MTNKNQQLYFKTKTISWKDSNGEFHMNRILLQNNNGPCFIISFTNTLIISTELQDLSPLVESDTSIYTGLKQLLVKPTVSLDSLLNELSSLMLSKNEINITKEGRTQATDISEILNALPHLTAGLNVSLSIDNCTVDSFGVLTDAINQLLHLFDIRMIHGLIDDEIVDDCKLKTFDECQDFMIFIIDKYGDEKIDQFEQQLLKQQTNGGEEKEENEALKNPELINFIKVRDFLNLNKTQLSAKGLSIISLDDTLLKPNSTCLFFRNDHFNTMFKNNKNELFVLVSDIGYASEQEVVWEQLLGLNNSGVLLNGSFETPDLTGKLQKLSVADKEKILKQQQIQNPDHSLASAPDAEIGTSGNGMSNSPSNAIDYGDYTLDDIDADADPFDESGGSGGADAMLAKQLQEEEDENYSRALQKQLNNERRNRSARRARERQLNQTPGGSGPRSNPSNKKVKSKDSSCVLM
ncbi:unnamed protein product [Ambrosiozyma monospora]|uniref:Unnamed protein product n=1 Tax=Ambrosiozyma monospora TaxID=43982 RepID=A0ACB5STZ5_AMBMO|nr:unnamed protein product [Ambrosiozyma monospora]